MSVPSRLSADKRISGYKAHSGQSSPGDPSYYTDWAPRGDRLTGPQRRRAIHKSGGQGGWDTGNAEDRENLTDPDRWQSSGKGHHTYLNPKQFATMKEVRGMGAKDMGGPGHTIDELIPKKQREVARGSGDTADYDLLTDAMRRGGPAGGKVPPILLERNDWGGGESEWQVGNGGHRIAIAHDLGWKAMPVTHSREESGYGDERFQGGGGDSDYDSGSSSSRQSQPSSDYVSESSEHYDSQASSHIGGVNRRDNQGNTSNARSYIPPGVAAGANQRGANVWHGGRDQFGATKAQGLYTELHGPAPEALSGKQFGPAPPNHPGKMAGGQPALPGMNVTRNVGRSAFDRNPPNGPRGGVWTGGAAPGAAAGMGRAETQAGPKRRAAEAAAEQAAPGQGAPESNHRDGPMTKMAAQMRGHPNSWRQHAGVQGQTSAPHGRWPGGGKILTGDL